MQRLGQSRRIDAVVILFTLLGSVSSVAATSRYLPGVASAPGRNGTFFESTVWVTNFGDSDGSVTFDFIGSAVAAPPAAERAIGAGATISRPLKELFGLENTFGTLVVSSESPIKLRGTTSDVSRPKGTYGLDLTTFAPESVLLAGETAVVPWLSASRDTTGFRTNLGVALIAPGTIVVLTLFDEAGFVRGVRLLDSSVPLSWQVSASDIAGDPEIPIGRIEAEVRRGEAIVYSAIVDSRTGDGMLMPAERASSFGRDWLVDGVAHSPGLNGTNWSTDLRLVNPNLAPLSVTIAFLGGGASRSIDRFVPPRGSLEIADVLGPSALAAGDSAAGAIRVTAEKEFLAAARTANWIPAAPGSSDLLT